MKRQNRCYCRILKKWVKMLKPKEIIGNSEGEKIDLLFKLPDYIKYRNNELMIEDVSAMELIKEYGTPLFVLSLIHI